MAKPSLRRTMRSVHYWTSLAVLIVGGLVAVTGVILLLKKEIAWLQPPVADATRAGASSARVDALFNAASAAAPEPLDWDRIDRIDVRPSDGIAKVITDEAAEYQVDLQTLKVVSTGYRGADFIEKIHDGSAIASWAKYWLMLPSGVALFALWLTGVYLFFLPRIQKWRGKRR